MQPSVWLQGVLSSGLNCGVFSQFGSSTPEEFVLHSVTTNKPVPNGGTHDSMDVTVSFAVVSDNDDRAWEIAQSVTELVDSAYVSGTVVGVTGLAYYEATMLPVKQPRVEALTAPGSHEYNSVFRMIFV